MILLQEVLRITNQERAYIIDYVERLRNQFEQLRDKNGRIPVKKFYAVSSSIGEEDLFKGQAPIPLLTKLVWDYGNWKAKFIAVAPGFDNIKLNLRELTVFKEKKEEEKSEAEKKSGKRKFYVSSIRYNEIRSSLVHEIIHFHQWNGKTPTFPFNSTKNYMYRGYERSAWGAEDVENIRQRLEPTSKSCKSIAPKVMSVLRNNGFLNDALVRLKAKNPKAWKQIMKKAVLIAMKDMKKSDKLPWQNPTLP